LSSPRKPPRKIPKAPFKVLEAPQIQVSNKEKRDRRKRREERRETEKEKKRERRIIYKQIRTIST
jgi:hypothetical protein